MVIHKHIQKWIFLLPYAEGGFTVAYKGELLTKFAGESKSPVLREISNLITINYMKTPVHNTLREHRIKAGLRQLDVACHLGFNNTNRVSRWEKGTAFPNVTNLIGMAKLFGVHAEELYPGLGNIE